MALRAVDFCAASPHKHCAHLMLWGGMMNKLMSAAVLSILVGSLSFSSEALALTASNTPTDDTSVGRHLAETVCSDCHQIGPEAPPSKNPKAPNFVDISKLPDLSIKVFLRSSHPTMPNFILSLEEIDSVTAYIKSLGRK